MEKKDCCPIEQSRRQKYLNILYDMDGRRFPEHPYHATFSGLSIKRKEYLIHQDMLLMTERS